MYDFIKTDKGWIVYWGPAPVPQTAAASKTWEPPENEPWVIPFPPRRLLRKPELAPVA